MIEQFKIIITQRNDSSLGYRTLDIESDDDMDSDKIIGMLFHCLISKTIEHLNMGEKLRDGNTSTSTETDRASDSDN